MIASMRAALVADLAIGDMPVFTAWPARVTPPCLFVTPSSFNSYVTGSDLFGEYVVALDVVALVAQATPDIALVALDEVIETVLQNTVDWRLDGCDSPSLVTVNGVDYLGTIIHLTKLSRL